MNLKVTTTSIIAMVSFFIGLEKPVEARNCPEMGKDLRQQIASVIKDAGKKYFNDFSVTLNHQECRDDKCVVQLMKTTKDAPAPYEALISDEVTFQPPQQVSALCMYQGEKKGTNVISMMLYPLKGGD